MSKRRADRWTWWGAWLADAAPAAVLAVGGPVAAVIGLAIDDFAFVWCGVGALLAGLAWIVVLVRDVRSRDPSDP